MDKKLWTPNFTRMFSGWILSALGGVGFNAALSVVVFDNTQSTFMSAIFAATTTLPSLILPLFVGPYVDRKDPLKALLKNEKILVLVFAIATVYVHYFSFKYEVYLILVSIISILSVISDLSTQSVAAQLMHPDMMSKGYAILSTISPLAQVVVAPVALLVYKSYGISVIFAGYTVLSILDILIERSINHSFVFGDTPISSIRELFVDIKDGFIYLKKHRPIRTVYIFFTFVIISNGFSSLIYPYFERSLTLTTENYAFLMSINSLGYLLGGFFHYWYVIPNKYRYRVALIIYGLFIGLDGVFLLLPFAGMVLAKFVLGLCGMNSANIRGTAVQASLDPKYRAKVNGFFTMLMALASIVGSLMFGYLGDIMPIPYVVIIAQVIYLFATVIFIIPSKNKVKQLYNLELKHIEGV